MAAFMHCLLTAIDPELKSSFLTCWFPDNTTLREFKEICCSAIKTLENKHIVF